MSLGTFINTASQQMPWITCLFLLLKEKTVFLGVLAPGEVRLRSGCGALCLGNMADFYFIPFSSGILFPLIPLGFST